MDEELFRGLDDLTDDTDPGVGAHTQHLTGDTYGTPLECADCHVVPRDIDGTDHFFDGRGEIRFSALAAAGGVGPAWDPVTRTCSQVYCHGALPPDEDDEDWEPKLTFAWDESASVELECDGCHLVPPSLTRTGLPHPPSPACEVCHDDANIDLEITDKSLHINGVIDVSE
jgi:predicted CxxxxCH...CXXCH cytochrome family protein